MRLPILSAWIFAFLLLLALLFLLPIFYILAFTVITLPIVIAAQVMLILKAQAPASSSTNHPWYEQHP